MKTEELTNKIWHIAPRVHDDLVAQLLHNRGLSIDKQQDFLFPNWQEGMHSPYLFTKMEQAVNRMFQALEQGEHIVIHGDYDADGVSGSTLLHGALHDIAKALSFPIQLEVFLPDREHDGYGVSMHTIERFGQEGIKLLVTIDCGIANGLELGRAHELGMDVIVCDHHQLGQHFPEQAIILHPLAPGETYPNKTLCGTGVSFKFASALIHEAQKRGAHFPEGYEKWFLDLVAIATVTDVMPLIGENRVLEYYGLRVLQKTRRPGLRAIIEATGTNFADIDTQTIGFRIGPRLNAAGRMTSAQAAFRALSATTVIEAQEAALTLEQLNRQRQSVFTAAYEEAVVQVKEMLALGPVLSVYASHWLPGIVGLIAGRLVSDFGRPAFAFTKVGEHVVGSGRSLGGLHLVELMNACGDELYVKRGGHPQACGLTLHTEAEVSHFRERANIFAEKFYGDEGVRDLLHIDTELHPAEASFALCAEIQRCAPFGEGNRPPIFAATQMTVVETSAMGSTGSHLRLRVEDGEGKSYRFVGFGFGNKLGVLRIGEKLDIAYEISLNEWNGKREVQCRIVDIRSAHI